MIFEDIKIKYDEMVVLKYEYVKLLNESTCIMC